MKAKIDKILETPADEREIVENGKIFKKALDIILIAINIMFKSKRIRILKKRHVL